MRTPNSLVGTRSQGSELEPKEPWPGVSEAVPTGAPGGGPQWEAGLSSVDLRRVEAGPEGAAGLRPTRPPRGPPAGPSRRALSGPPGG